MKNLLIDYRIGLIGCGAMGTAIIQGIINNKTAKPEQITVFDIDQSKTDELKKTCRVTTAPGAASLCSGVDIIILAVKPADYGSLLSETASAIAEKHLLISVAAGISSSYIEELLSPKKTRVIRMMPNTPCLIGQGAIACSAGSYADEQDLSMAGEITAGLGLTVTVKEKYMDAVTGLSGSGPAYIYLIIEALIDGGISAGLDRETATALVLRTVTGAGEMLIRTGKHPAELKSMVTSPAGTTMAGLQVMEDNALRGTIIRAVEAAVRRAGELSES